MKRELTREIDAEHESAGIGRVGKAVEPSRRYTVLRRTRLKGMDRTEITGRALRGLEWAGKAALFCFGLLAMLALAIVATVLTGVMLAATALPTTVVRQRRALRGRRGRGNSPKSSAPKKTKNVKVTSL